MFLIGDDPPAAADCRLCPITKIQSSSPSHQPSSASIFSDFHHNRRVELIMSLQDGCPLSLDDSFGPTIRGCRDDFDFTWKFEQCFLAIAPSAIMLLAGALRFQTLQHRTQKLVNAPNFKWTKTVRNEQEHNGA
jgi:hypothetical protein